MRTTVTLDDDVASRVKELAHVRRTSFKEALNEVLRRGLNAQDLEGAAEPRFEVRPHPGGFRPGVDPRRLNQLVDELEVRDFLEEAGGKR